MLSLIVSVIILETAETAAQPELEPETEELEEDVLEETAAQLPCTAADNTHLEGTWVSTSSVTLVEANSSSIPPSISTMSGADELRVEMVLRLPETETCGFDGFDAVVTVTSARNTSEILIQQEFLGVISTIPSDDIQVLVLQDAMPVSSRSEMVVTQTKAEALYEESEDGVPLIELFYGGREDETTVVALSAVLIREEDEKEGVEAVTCPDISGDWKSGKYDALNVGDEGDTIPIQNLNMTLTVSQEAGSCAFLGVNAWSNGVIGADEPVIGLIHSDGVTASIFEFVPLEFERAPTTAVIIAKLLSPDSDDVDYIDFIYAGANHVTGRIASFNVVISNKDALDDIPQLKCEEKNMLGTWESEPFTLYTRDHETLDVSAMPNVTMTFDVYEENGCRFAAYATRTGGEQNVVVGTIHNENEMYGLETGKHDNVESKAMVFGKLEEDDTLTVICTGERVVDGVASEAMSFEASLSRDNPL